MQLAITTEQDTMLSEPINIHPRMVRIFNIKMFGSPHSTSVQLSLRIESGEETAIALKYTVLRDNNDYR